MHKFLDTSNLQRYNSGNNKGKIDWANNVGKQLYFEYDDIKGYISIEEYIKGNHGRVRLKYKDNEVIAMTQNLLNLKISSFLNKNKISMEYKYNIGDIITKDNDSMKVLEYKRFYIPTSKINSSFRGYKLKCQFCNYIYETRESLISTCPICGKRASYAEKFVYAMLRLANIYFIPQHEFNELPIRYFDAYLPDYNCVIEINGLQHYEPTRLNKNQSKEESFLLTQKSDEIKQEFAKQHDIKFYEIDARNIYILYQVTKTTLDFLDFSNVSELECLKFVHYKTVYPICDLWNKGFSIDEICKQTKKSLQYIQTKLRIGNACGFCIYDKNINYSKKLKWDNNIYEHV